MDYNILIVEDDSQIAESLQEMLEILGHTVVGVAESYDNAIKLLENGSIDLVLLDIQLKGDKTGIDIAESIKEKYQLPFVFTSAYADDETINAASQHSPYGYIIKPYSMNDIKAAIEIAIHNHRSIKEFPDDKGGLVNKESLFVKHNSRIVRIDINDILYIEASGDYAIFKTPNKGYIVNTTIKKLESKLDPTRFVKIHRSYIINLDKVIDIEENSLLIADQILPISRGQKANLIKLLDII